MQLYDAVTVDDASVRTTRDGYLVADARIARTGIQHYTAGELGLEGRNPRDVIRVYRPPEAVFDAQAMAGLAHRPLTNDHPPENVTADNWKKYSIGTVGGDITRDGDFVRVPLTMMDAGAISEFRAGKRQLSVGYTCELTMKDGVTPEGEAYDAVQSDIQGNHLALCHRARGGPELRIGDDTPKGENPMRTITVDGIKVEVDDNAASIIDRLQTQAKDSAAALADANTKVGELTATISTKDGEIAALNKKVEDAVLTPEALDKAVQERSAVVAVAKSVLGDSFKADGQTVPAIKKAVVAQRLGDAAASMDDNGINGAYAVLAKTVADGAGSDEIRDAVRIGDGVSLKGLKEQRDEARAKAQENMAKAYL